MQDFPNGSGLIFMKIGTHAREPLEEIIDRKRKELDRAGRIFWGYGGSTCHPVNVVRPFANAHAKAGKTVHLAMQKMVSQHFAEPELSKEYSDDGVDWRPIPQGIQVRGSRYAIVLDSLEDTEFLLDLNAIRVAQGRTQGRSGFDYLRGHVDKGCFEVVESPVLSPVDSLAPTRQQAIIGLVAKVVSPYAVFLR